MIYTNQATLFAIPFDVNRLETRGTAVPVLNDIAYTPAGRVSLSFAQNGALVYRRGDAVGATQIQWVDSTGKKEAAAGETRRLFQPSNLPGRQTTGADSR